MLHFIYNPIAGKGRARKAREVIEPLLEKLGVDCEFHVTASPKDASDIAKQLTARGEHKIVAMGGDGTVNEVLNGLTDPAQCELGIIPCGSGNDFAAAARIPSDPEKALRLILDSTAKPTDYLDCSGVRALNIIGTGLDVKVLEQCAKAKVLKGSLNYFVSLLITLAHFTLDRFSTDRDGRTGTHNGMVVCACNGTRFGGGLGICPAAVIDDGRLDLVLVQDVSKPNILGGLIALVRGKVLEKTYTLHELTETLRVTFDKPVPIQIDGEIYRNLPFDVRTVHGALRVFRP